ncbi:hypothetical protein CU097_004108 [Rhizopus azygosporus]|uniref:Uncharacterized protein n=1 Tax=Rhizopus azygosporus TaxID=86630 RepID=A0A367JV93_RHIAZ|nr:hypothetical protein CU097_004108 [Rhizopus azygosporus]
MIIPCQNEINFIKTTTNSPCNVEADAAAEIDIYEYSTSKACNSYLVNNLNNQRCGSGKDEYKIHQILICERCNIFWNRGVMAAKNMFTITESFWNDNDRSNVFQRQSATSNMVAASHSDETMA